MNAHPVYKRAMSKRPNPTGKPPSEAALSVRKRSKIYLWLNFLFYVVDMGTFTCDGKSPLQSAMYANFWTALVSVGHKQDTSI